MTAKTSALRRFLLPTTACAVLGALLAVTLLGDLSPVPLAVPPAATATLPAAAPATASDGATASERLAPAAAMGCWTAPAGATFRYLLRDALTVQLDGSQQGHQSTARFATEAEVTTTVLDRRDDEILVRHSLAATRFLDGEGREVHGDVVQESFAAAARTPVLVRLATDGTVLGYGFAPTLDADQRNFLRGTLGLLACQEPAPGVTSWESEVADTTGVFVARHERLPAAAPTVVVRRTRLRYTVVAGHDAVPEQELGGATEVHFATDLGWLTTVAVDERLSLALPVAELRAVTARRASVTLQHAGHTAIDEALAAAWAAASAPAAGHREAVTGFASERDRARQAEGMRGVTLDGVLAELQRLVAAQPVDAYALDGVFQQLQRLLADPQHVAAVQELVANGALGNDGSNVLVGALGAAGTPAAQAALTTLRADLGVATPVREQATIACLQLAAPTPALVGGLFADAAGDSALRDTSLLVAGALAHRAGEPLADGRTPLQALLAMEGEATARGGLSTWLLAVANSGAPEVLPTALRLLDHADRDVRAAACVALRGPAEATALRALLERGLADQDPIVRTETVLSLSRRPEPAAREALERVASEDQDESVRGRARRLLERGE
jgi:hypothetical protein